MLAAGYALQSRSRTATQAGTRHPFDSDAIADLQPGGLGSRTKLDDVSDALVAADLIRGRRFKDASPLQPYQSRSQGKQPRAGTLQNES